MPGSDLFPQARGLFALGHEVSREVSVERYEMAGQRNGVSGLATDADYAAERAEMEAYPHEDFRLEGLRAWVSTMSRPPPVRISGPRAGRFEVPGR